MKFQPLSIAILMLLGLTASCTDPDEGGATPAGSGGAEAVNLDQKAQDAAAGITEENADAALQEMENELSEGN